MRILLVEPDPAIAANVQFALNAEGLNVYVTGAGEEAIDLGKIYDYDAIVAEISLPDITGFDVIRQLRTAKIKTPILVLSKLAGVEERVKALGLGADDFLTKPFHQDELVARLRALVRRSRGVAQPHVTVDGLTVHLDSRLVTLDGKRVSVTNKEYGVLELLALRRGTLVTKDMILNHLYGGMDEPETPKIIDVFVCKLRRKLEDTGSRIETVWGRGFILRSRAEAAQAA